MRPSRVAPLLAVCGAIIGVLGACETFTDIPAPITFAATLNGANERPTQVVTDATGSFSAAVHITSAMISYTVTWTGLSGSATGAHIHGPADANGTAGVLVDFTAPPGGNGSASLSPDGGATGEIDLLLAVTPTVSGDSLRTLLNAGMLYVNVHTEANPDGEIRGQVTRTN